MWRRLVLAILPLLPAMALLAACGGGAGGVEGTQTCDRNSPIHTPAISELSVNEAEATLGLRLLVPTDLPADASQGAVRVVRSGICPYHVISVETIYQGPGYRLSLQQGGQTNDQGTPVQVNGVEGQMRQVGDHSLLIWWRQGDRSFMVEAGLGGELTQQRLLQILESIPE